MINLNLVRWGNYGDTCNNPLNRSSRLHPCWASAHAWQVPRSSRCALPCPPAIASIRPGGRRSRPCEERHSLSPHRTLRSGTSRSCRPAPAPASHREDHRFRRGECACARPAPLFRSRDQSRPHGIERNLAQRADQMRLVYRDRAEPPLPQMAGHAPSHVDVSCIATMGVSECPPQPFFIAGHRDDMNVVGHQAIRPDRHARSHRRIGQQVEIES
jgi:hypothetical protein